MCTFQVATVHRLGGKLLRVAGNRRGTTAGIVQGVVVPVCASSKPAVAIDDL